MAEQNPRPVVVAVRHDLHAALERAHDLVEGMPVTTELRIGRVVPTIVDMAKEARLIVLERRDLSTMMRGRDPFRLHQRGRPRSPTRSHGGSPLVTVGIDVPERAEQALRAAAAEAKSRGAVLRALHTWSLPSAYDDIIFSRTESQESADRPP